MEDVESQRTAFELLKADRSKFEDGYANRCIEFAIENLDSDIGLDALLWVTTCNRNTAGFKEANDLAIEKLVTKHLDHPKTQAAVYEMHKQRSPKTIEHLRSLMNCENETIRGLAAFSLGVRIKSKDRSEALSLLENVALNYSGLSVTLASGKLVDVHTLAVQYIHDFNSLECGMPAPPTQGADLDNAPLDLHQYRGKIVMLSFWADW